MKRTKSKSIKLPSGSKNVGTQTENFDNLIEVAKLEQQVRLLQLENDVLRKHTEQFSSKPDPVHNQKLAKLAYLTPQATAKVRSPLEKTGCGCKGNCSSRICGCVKKSIKCGPSCKCDDKICQNQKLECDQENKENVNGNDVKLTETPKKQTGKKNETAEKTIINKGLFSPSMRELYKDLEEGQFSDIYFSFNEDTITKNLQTNSESIDNVGLRKKRMEKKEENDKEQQELTEKVIFDPMKPRHVLSRTPPNSKKLEKSLEIEKIIQPQLHSTPAQEGEIMSLVEVQGIKEEEVDWEEHTAQLIPCKKCKRTFLPDRIQKHEACCKKV